MRRGKCPPADISGKESFLPAPLKLLYVEAQEPMLS